MKHLGLSLLKQVRKDPMYDDVRVMVFVKGLGDNPDVEARYMKAGVVSRTAISIVAHTDEWDCLVRTPLWITMSLWTLKCKCSARGEVHWIDPRRSMYNIA